MPEHHPLFGLEQDLDLGSVVRQLHGQISDSLRLRVLDLPTLIETKIRTGRAKDRLVLPILVALVNERGL